MTGRIAESLVLSLDFGSIQRAGLVGDVVGT